MANFVEFEYTDLMHKKTTKYSLNLDTVSSVHLDYWSKDVSVNSEDEYWVKVDESNRSLSCSGYAFRFKTKSEAQELYDKLRGKKKEDTAPMDKQIKIMYNGAEEYINLDRITHFSFFKHSEGITWLYAEQDKPYTILVWEHKNKRPYSFKTEVEAQDLVDKLRGKKKDDSPTLKQLKEEIEPSIKLLEFSLLIEDINCLIEMGDSHENTISKIKNLINYKYKNPPIAKNATESAEKETPSLCTHSAIAYGNRGAMCGICSKFIEEPKYHGGKNFHPEYSQDYFNNRSELPDPTTLQPTTPKTETVHFLEVQLERYAQKLDQIRELVKDNVGHIPYSREYRKHYNYDELLDEAFNEFTAIKDILENKE